MNLSGCANCLLHGWKQVEDPSALQRCTRCKLIQYCGRECQAEHWERIHKKQCKYFADPAKALKWGHNQDDCAICIQEAKVGKAEICRATNPNYECIFKEKFPSHLYHPHPFPITGQPGDTYEKIIIVLWQLLKKFELTQPGLILNCQGKLVKVYAELKMIRLNIWRVKKIFRPTERLSLEKFRPHSLDDLLDTIKENVASVESTEDPYQLEKIIDLIDDMILDVYLALNMQVLINPLADLPADLHTIVSLAVSNSAKFLVKANHVLEALSNQVVPYKNLLRIVCGDSLDKSCNFCKENITIASMGRFYSEDSSVFFNCLFMQIYHCGTVNCGRKAMSMIQDYTRLQTALMTTMAERISAQCDFCSKLPPSKGGHRCSKCLTVIYCSVTCRDQDREIHKEFCKEDEEERKKKFGSSGRRKDARGSVEQVEKVMEEMALEVLKTGTETVQLAHQGACQVVNKFKLKGASKNAKK